MLFVCLLFVFVRVICLASSWIAPTCGGKPDIEYNPYYPYRNDSTGGLFQHYQLGIGGSKGSCCSHFDPSAGFWCSNKTQGGDAFTYIIPSGITFDSTILPQSYLYKNLTNGVIQAWHPDYWASWIFEIDNEKLNLSENSIIFKKGKTIRILVL